MLLIRCLLVLVGLSVAGRAMAQAPLRIAMSLSDVPNLWGVPDGGFEGVRFGGYTLYDSLVEWDLSSADTPSRLIPGLATAWTLDAAHTRWTFTLREARFHDGTPWNADAAVWNLDSLLNPAAPQYNAVRAAIARTRTVSITGYGKIDDRTIFIDTARPTAFLLYELSGVFFVSPAGFAQLGGDWNQVSQHPVGTGPYRFVSLSPRREAVFAANTEYWNQQRVPKTARLVLLPVPDANTRTAALRSGQVDMIDTLQPDSIEPLRAAGFQIVMNVYPHTWLWRLNFTAASPFSDVRVRKAVNLAIDRAAMVDLLSGTGVAAHAFQPAGSPWFGKPSFDIHFAPEAAKRLLAEAGYGPSHPLKLNVLIASGGGGQMVPLSMNELIQENLRDVGVEVSYQVADFTSMIGMLRAGAKVAKVDAINVAMTMEEPSNGISTYESRLAPPAGSNWGFYANPDFDEAIRAAQAEFDPARQDQAFAHLNEVLTDDAAAIVVVHDLGPRAMSPKLRGFVQARNWYQDYTTITVGE